MAVVDNPCRGLLRVRRPLYQELTVLLGLATDFDLLGNDPAAAAKILRAVVVRYCRADTIVVGGEGSGAGARLPGFGGEDYGGLLRRQVNLQYLLDCLRIRFNRPVASPTKGLLSMLSRWPKMPGTVFFGWLESRRVLFAVNTGGIGFGQTGHFLVNEARYVLLSLMMLSTTPCGRLVRWNA